ncbi:MAG: hypothetical protein KDI75_06645 [Xanthomonadales bacterium]|nr:hypothetical protein [Xanthomonadales bacterium]
MTEKSMVAVFLHEQALEVLGATVKPYLSDGPAGPHLLRREVDVGGAFVEVSMDGRDKDGNPVELELMVPTGFIRLVVSVRSDGDFGFV